MKKSDLQTGMVVVTRDERRWIVLLDAVIHGCERTSIIANIDGEMGVVTLGDYNENLEIISCTAGLEMYDIMRVEKSLFFGILPNPNEKDTITIWERPEPTKEMTLSEIEKALGHKVKIINDN